MCLRFSCVCSINIFRFHNDTGKESKMTIFLGFLLIEASDNNLKIISVFVLGINLKLENKFSKDTNIFVYIS